MCRHAPPWVLGAACHAFYSRDADDCRVASRMRRFGPAQPEAPQPQPQAAGGRRLASSGAQEVAADATVSAVSGPATGAADDAASATAAGSSQHAAGGGADPDMQLLLFNMRAHEMAVQLLNLPIGKSPASSELEVREVIIGAYRLIKALSSGFKLMQMAMLPFQDKMIEHVEYNLTSADVTPTNCLISIMKDNPTAALQVREDVLRKFVRMAAEKHAPRFLRFLFNVTGPAGQPVIRAQALVIQLIRENTAACVLFNDAEGRIERRKLIEASDHVNNPRGKLVYHIELIRLIGRCADAD